MKLSHSLALLVTAALTLPSTVADFHITQTSDGYDRDLKFVACPSNYFTCDCLVNGDRTAQIVTANPPRGFFHTTGNFCEVTTQLNFYERDGGYWQFYENNGDGTLQGTCYSNSAQAICNLEYPLHWVDQLVCYSYICGH
jgi:hypothetical protein